MGDAIMHTPAKHLLAVPTSALAEAITVEWQTVGKYISSKMPLTTLAYTAIDRIAGQEKTIIDVLLVYLDTDALSYRASGSEELAKRQIEQWNPLLEWENKKLGVIWQTTSGVMPTDQSPELHKAISAYLSTLNEFELAAASVLSSSLSSLALTLALLERHIDAQEAFRLSRLEEDYQAEKWGHDAETQTRANRLKDEISDAARFLGLQRAP